MCFTFILMDDIQAFHFMETEKLDQCYLQRYSRRYKLTGKNGKNFSRSKARGMVVVDMLKEIKDPVKFLTTQTKLDLDMVKLVREVRSRINPLEYE